MSTLELNLKAKRTIVPTVAQPEGLLNKPIPTPPMGVFGPIEVGKRYILRNGKVTQPLVQATAQEHLGRLCANIEHDSFNTVRYWDKATGVYSMFGVEHQRSIVAEWHDAWMYEKAWKEGKPIEIYHLGTWYPGTTYKQICLLFGEHSASTKNFWMKQFAKYGLNNIRIAE